MNYNHLTRPNRPASQTLYWLTLAASIVCLVVILGVGPRRWLQAANDLFFPAVVQLTNPTIATVPDPTEQATEHRATELNQLLHRHWENALLAIESMDNKKVTILEFQPDFNNAGIVLRGEAKEFDALADYIKELNSTGLLRHVVLVHEQAVSREHVDTIEFEISGEIELEKAAHQ